MEHNRYLYSVQIKQTIYYHGWTIKKGKKHYKYVHPDFDYFIPVGRHRSQEIPNGTLEKMLRQAGIKGSNKGKGQ